MKRENNYSALEKLIYNAIVPITDFGIAVQCLKTK